MIRRLVGDRRRGSETQPIDACPRDERTSRQSLLVEATETPGSDDCAEAEPAKKMRAAVHGQNTGSKSE